MGSNPTPTPWKAEGRITAAIFGPDDQVIAAYVAPADRDLIIAAVNAYEANKARIAKLRDCTAKLLSELERITDSAETLSRELFDPGTEALAAIYCAKETMGRARAILERSNGE